MNLQAQFEVDETAMPNVEHFVMDEMMMRSDSESIDIIGVATKIQRVESLSLASPS